jgi:hypothetical protein
MEQGEIRFAVGHPDGLTSNSWKMWANPKGDVYLACRDNFTDTKVSLHASGRWRMAFTNEALKKRPELRASNRNRAWEVWDEPPASLPGTVTAFRLFFPAFELAVRPEQRTTRIWKKRIVFVEAPPTGKLTVVTLFITTGETLLRHESEPSICLASLDIGNNRRAQLIAHGDPEGDFPEWLNQNVALARAQEEWAGVKRPETAYGYFFGRRDGAPFIVGARMTRAGG